MQNAKGPGDGRGLLASPSIGATGFEPAAFWSQTRRSTKLSYAPDEGIVASRIGFGTQGVICL